MKLRNKIIAIITSIVCLSGFLCANVNAAGSPGGGNSSGWPPLKGWGEDCEADGVGRGECVHWVKASVDTFRSAWNIKRGSGYDTAAYNTCVDATKNPSRIVVFAGYNGYKSSTLYLFNDMRMIGYKLDHSHASDGNGSNFRNFFGDRLVTNASMTYQQLMDAVAGQLGVGERELAFFCEGMLVQPPSDNPQSCALSPDAVFSDNYGNTVAQSTVSNLSKKSNNYAATAFNTAAQTVSVYAKPGDSIRFSHALCYGAQAVAGNSGYQPMGSARYTTASSNPANKFSITSYISGVRRDEYLFDNSANIKSGQTYTLDQGQAMPSLARRAEETYTYGLRIQSPGSNARNTYKCAVGAFSLISSNSFKDYGYQIPDMLSAAYIAQCASANKVGTSTNGQYSNAGQVIEQRLSYNNVQRWVNTKTSLTTNGCGCNLNGNRSSTHSVGSYESAKNDKSGYWGDILHNCEGNGTCSCNCYSYACGTQADGTTNYCQRCSTCSRYKTNSRDFYTHYGISANDTAGGTKSAQAIIPYNFKTSVTSTINLTDPVVYGGDTVDVTLDFSILGRRNPDVDPDNDYATITPDYTQVKPIEFIVPAGANINLQGGLSTAGPCAYFGYAEDGTNCNAFNVQTGSQNPEGSYRGASGQITANGNSARTIPDQEVGKLYCVAVGIYPADSHNQPDSDLGSGVNALDRAFNGQAGRTSNQWRISGASCRTIAKKPTFQVWNDGVSTEGAINTALTKKNVSASFGSYNEANTRIFGSWDEQMVIAGRGRIGSETIGVRGFASGASLGYNPATYSLGLPGGHSFTKNFSDLSRLTISNKSTNFGNSSISFPTTTIDRLLARYSNLKTDASPWVADSNTGGRRNSETGLEYINLGSGGTISGTSKPAGDSTKDNTRIYYSSGTINITGNVCYGSSCGGESTVLNSYNLESRSISALPQIIIIAQNINIDHNVTRIDAWLVAENQLDTCTHDAGQRYDLGSHFTSDQCAQTLVINGPTFAGQLRLMRTAGARPGTGSAAGSILQRNLKNDGTMAPAEVFNLRADAYFWAYAQAQRYSEAVTTYTRELSPRL